MGVADSSFSGNARKPGHVSREELQELRRDVRELLLSAVDTIVADREGLGRYSERPHTAKGKGVESTVGEAPQPQVVATAPATELPHTVSAGGITEEFPVGLWIAAILIFGFGDSLTSTLAFSAGAHEANPIMVSLLQVLGGSFWGFIVIKTLIMTVLFVISYYLLDRWAWLIALLLCAIGSFLVLNNLIAYFSAI